MELILLLPPPVPDELRPIRLLGGEQGCKKSSVFLVGGLAPRYLVAARPPEAPAHAGTLDVDIVIDLQILADTAGYRMLEENPRAMRFERSTTKKGAEAFIAVADSHRRRRADGGRTVRRRAGDCRWQGSTAAYGREHFRAQHPAFVRRLRNAPGRGGSGRAPWRWRKRRRSGEACRFGELHLLKAFAIWSAPRAEGRS